MEKLIIEPGNRIGNIKIGMPKKQAEFELNQYIEKYEKGTNYFDFFKNAFQIEYDESERVKFIEIIYEVKDFFNCFCYDIDVFQTKAEDLIARLSQISDYSRVPNDETQFIFENIGLSLWRSSVFKEESIQETWFKEMNIEDQQEEMKYMYFQTVAVYANDGSYYNGMI